MDTIKLIYEAIDEINVELEEEQRISKTESTQIFGANSSLDSLELINLISIIEQKVEEEAGVFISLADEKAMSFENSPFKTVTTLKEYIELRINENKS